MPRDPHIGANLPGMPRILPADRPAPPPHRVEDEAAPGLPRPIPPPAPGQQPGADATAKLEAFQPSGAETRMKAPTRRPPAAEPLVDPAEEIVRAPKLSHLVAERLRAQIANGELASGDSLPAEAELLKRFKVSRPTLREALRILESEQLIQLGRGARHGALVLGPSIGMAAQYGGLYLATHGTTLGDIHQVRMLLEPPLTSILAARKDKRFLDDLQDCIRQEQLALRDHDYVAAVGGTNDFHRRLVNLSENRALRLLAGMLHDISVGLYPQLVIAARRGQGETAAQRTERSVESHARLVQLLRAGKAAEAERFWRDYMQATAEWLASTRLASLRIEVPASPR